MICKNCNIDKDILMYYKNYKICKECKKKHEKCSHNKRKTLCIECKGRSICEHNHLKYTCKECKGNSLCKHNIRKVECKECGGSRFCQHNKEKYKCKDCKGSGICNHNRIKSKCKECGGGSICEHNRERTACKDCKGGSICEHNLRRSNCKECKGGSICEHNKHKSYCKECNGSQICYHKKFKRLCIECTPDSKYFCKNCRLFRVNNRTNYLCSYCNPEKVTYIKTKELQLKSFLEQQNYKFYYNKKCNINNLCQTYFPDFLIDCNTFFLIIECDEYAHKNYPIQCEKIRENNICYALGLPCVFIRFNPDKKGITINTKQKVLKSYIEYYKNKEKNDNIVEYLFYNK